MEKINMSQKQAAQLAAAIFADIEAYIESHRADGNNTDYPYKMEILSKEDLEEVMRYDHMCAECKENHRKKENFISADCSMFDVDNTDNDDPKKWTTPEDVKKAFPDVTYTDVSEYNKHKRKVCQYFTAFDPLAKDAARVFFEVEQPEVEYFSGSRRLSELMKGIADQKSDGNKQSN